MKRINPAIITAIYVVILMGVLGYLLPRNIMCQFEFIFPVTSAIIIWWQDLIWRKHMGVHKQDVK